MISLKQMMEYYVEEGYTDINAEARVCQDIILMAIANSSLSRNVTIKGGVVMRSLTGNKRRATQDMDIDFIRYSLSDESIDKFIGDINCLDGVCIVRFGDIEELSQQEYNGKRVYVKITDDFCGSSSSYGMYEGVLQERTDIGIYKVIGLVMRFAGVSKFVLTTQPPVEYIDFTRFVAYQLSVRVKNSNHFV